MLFAVVPLAAWAGLTAFPATTPPAGPAIAHLERQIEVVDAAILAHKFRAGLDLPVAPMGGPVRLAGYRPGDIADGRVERAFLPVVTPGPADLRQTLADKLAELAGLRRDYPLADQP